MFKIYFCELVLGFCPIGTKPLQKCSLASDMNNYQKKFKFHSGSQRGVKMFKEAGPIYLNSYNS